MSEDKKDKEMLKEEDSCKINFLIHENFLQILIY